MPFAHTHPQQQSLASHSHQHYSHLYSHSTRSNSRSPTHSPNTSARRSLNMDDEYLYAYEFPQYTYVPPPSPVSSLSPLSPSSTGAGKAVVRNSATPGPRNRDRNHQVHDTMAPPSSAAPPSTSGRFSNNSSPYPSTAISASTQATSVPPSAFTSSITSALPNGSRARGPSFASTTSYASSSTASSTSSAGPATPPRTSHPLSPSARGFRPYWERAHQEDEDRLDERAEIEEEGQSQKVLGTQVVPHEEEEDEEEEEEDSDDEYASDARRYSAASNDFARYMAYIAPSSTSPHPSTLYPVKRTNYAQARPRSVRRSPFADEDPAAPYSHVYLDDEYPPAPTPVAARRLSGSYSSNTPAAASRRRLTESPRSVARSLSLNHGRGVGGSGRTTPRRVNSPIMMNSLSLARSNSNSNSNSRPHSPSLSARSNGNSNSNSSSPLTHGLGLGLGLGHVSGNGNGNGAVPSPSPLHLNSPICIDSHSPSLNLPDPSPELDASPLRTALLLNPEPDFTLIRSGSEARDAKQEQQMEAGRRFSGRGLGLGGLGLQGTGTGINAALARRRAEWTEFEGDEYSVAGYVNNANANANVASSRDRDQRQEDLAAPRARGSRYLELELDADADDDEKESTPEERERERAHDDVDLSSPRTSFSTPTPTARPRVPHPYARVASPVEKRRSSHGYGYGSGYGSGYHGYGYPFRDSREVVSDDSRSVGARTTTITTTTSVERPSSSHLNASSSSSSSSSSSEKPVGEKTRNGKDGGEEGEGAMVGCLAFRWSVRARWAAVKLRVRLGAFRAARRVGLA